MRKNEMALTRTLRSRMGRLGGNAERAELLMGTALALRASGWSMGAVRRVVHAVSSHTFGEGVGMTMTNAICSAAIALEEA